MCVSVGIFEYHLCVWNFPLPTNPTTLNYSLATPPQLPCHQLINFYPLPPIGIICPTEFHLKTNGIKRAKNVLK